MRSSPPPTGSERVSQNWRILEDAGANLLGGEKSGSWIRFNCCRPQHQHGGGHTPKTAAFNTLTGMVGDHSFQCSDEGFMSMPFYVCCWANGLDPNSPRDRAEASAIMRRLGFFEERGEEIDPEGRRLIQEARDRKAAQQKAEEEAAAAAQALVVERRRREIVAWWRSQPPPEGVLIGQRGVFAKAAEAAAYAAQRDEWHFPVSPTSKLPADVDYGKFTGRFKYGSYSKCGGGMPEKCEREGNHIGTWCLGSKLAIVDVDYKNWVIYPDRSPFYERFSESDLRFISDWQHAITALLIQMSGGNWVRTGGGGLHILFSDPDQKFASTALTGIAGSVFELRDGRRPSGWIELRAGNSYCVTYGNRSGDGAYQPLPPMISEAAKLRQRKDESPPAPAERRVSTG